MSDANPIERTLNHLEEAVAGLTSTTNIDALRFIHRLGKSPGCSRHAAESAKLIAHLCSEAEADLVRSIDQIETEDDAAAEDNLGHALTHLDQIAETVASVASEQLKPMVREPVVHDKVAGGSSD